MANRIQFRRDNAVAWTLANPILAQGEFGIELGVAPLPDKIKLGDGITAWNDLGYWSGFMGPQGPQGDPGVKGDKGDTGNNGADGVGVISGGTTGQVLAKKSNTDFDTEWVNQSGGGGGGIVDAPIDTKLYGRKDGVWEEVVGIVGPAGPQGPAGAKGDAGDPKVLATQAEAEAGTDNSAYMSPLRSIQALKAQLIAGGNITLTPQAGGVEITASASGSTTFIYAPSKTQAGNVFNNWGDLTTHIAAMPDGEIPTVIFTESCTLPVGTYDMKLGKWTSPIISTGAITVTLPDGMLIQNLCYIQDGLQVNVEPTTADGVFVNTLFGGTNILVIGLGAKLVNLGTKAAIVTDGFVVIAQVFATIAVNPPSTAPWVKCLDGHTVQAIILGNLAFSQFEEDWVVGGGTTGNLLYFHGDSFAVPPLTQWTGNPPTYINSAKAEMVQYFDSFEPSVTTGATQVQQAIDWLKVNSLRDAPSDTKLYGRKDGAWAEVTGGGGGIADAPSNGMMYGRKDAAWGHALSPSTALVNLMGLLPFVSGDSVLWSAANPELPLSGVPTPGDVADAFGYQPTLIDGDLVWVQGRSTASENGVYSVDTAGAWTRVFNPAEHQDTLYLVNYPRLMYQDGTPSPVQSTAVYAGRPLMVRFDADGNMAATSPFPGVTGQASYVPFTVSKKEGGDAVWDMLDLGEEQSTLYPVAYTPRAQFDLATVLSGHILTIVPQAYADANINLADGYNPAVKDWATGAAYTYLQDNEEIVLVANQTDSSENGYYKPHLGTWSPVILFTTLKYCSKVTAEYNNIVPTYIAAKAGPAEVDIAFDGSLTSVRFVGGNVLEAPVDTKTYGRKDGGWVELDPGFPDLVRLGDQVGAVTLNYATSSFFAMAATGSITATVAGMPNDSVMRIVTTSKGTGYSLTVTGLDAYYGYDGEVINNTLQLSSNSAVVVIIVKSGTGRTSLWHVTVESFMAAHEKAISDIEDIFIVPQVPTTGVSVTIPPPGGAIYILDSWMNPTDDTKRDIFYTNGTNFWFLDTTTEVVTPLPDLPNGFQGASTITAWEHVASNHIHKHGVYMYYESSAVSGIAFYDHATSSYLDIYHSSNYLRFIAGTEARHFLTGRGERNTVIVAYDTVTLDYHILYGQLNAKYLTDQIFSYAGGGLSFTGLSNPVFQLPEYNQTSNPVYKILVHDSSLPGNGWGVLSVDTATSTGSCIGLSKPGVLPYHIHEVDNLIGYLRVLGVDGLEYNIWPSGVMSEGYDIRRYVFERFPDVLEVLLTPTGEFRFVSGTTGKIYYDSFTPNSSQFGFQIVPPSVYTCVGTALIKYDLS